MDEILKKYSLIKHLNVPRETFFDFEQFICMLLEKNREFNIISKKTSKNEVIRKRHIMDSVQVIDFVNLNCNTTTDLGSGGGFPGIIAAIIIKNMKIKNKTILYEKSHHKSFFLREVSRKLSLDTEVVQKDLFEIKKFNTGTIMARAFKPLPIILELVYKNFVDYKNLIIFMGKTGNETLEKTLREWKFDFEKKKSITNENSFLLNIKNIKRRN